MTGIAAEDLVVRRGTATLLERLSLSFGATGSVALIGPNGAGKTTLLKVLAGLEKPTSGRVWLDSLDLVAMSKSMRARAIGFLPQYFEPHWDLTVAQLVDLGAQRAGALPVGALEKTTEAFELVGLWGRRWSTLSGGERSRVLLAMVLVADPPILLADEPAAALDIRHRLDVIRALAERGRERLSVVVVHDLDLAFRFFERVVVVVDGKIAIDGATADVIGDRRLDAAFGVRFERLRTEQGWVLSASSESRAAG